MTYNRAEQPEDGYINLYEPGPRHERAYMRGIRSLYQSNNSNAGIVASSVIESDVFIRTVSLNRMIERCK